VVITQPTQRATSFSYIRSLDGLRGLLVFPVALYHFSLTSGAGEVFATGSFFAPSIFFALSGFLITSLLLVEKERTGGLDWRGFWRRRFRRLIPASVTIVFAVSLMSAIWPSIWAGLLPVSDVLAALLSVKNWQSIAVADQHVFRLLGPLAPYWSLAVEEQFYLGLSIVVAIAARTRHMLRWLTGLLIGVGIFSIASLIVHEDSLVREFFGTDTRASEIVAGCLVAVAVHHFGWPRSRWWPLVGWVSLVALVIAWATVPEDAAWVLAGGLALISFVSVGLIGGAIVPGSFAKALEIAPLVELGKISYPVYLVHWPVAMAMSPERMSMTGWPLIIVRFVVSVGLGYAIFRWVERPMRHSTMLAGRSGPIAWGSVGVASVVLAAIGMARL
jgi:peptidoglycan/LPS O-acetylase OafA/YrhL